YRRALEVAAALGDAGRLGRGIVLSNIGYELNVLGSHEEARVSLEEGLRIARDVSSTGLEAAILVNPGAAYTGLGRLGEASESLDRALALARERRGPGRWSAWPGWPPRPATSSWRARGPSPRWRYWSPCAWSCAA